MAQEIRQSKVLPNDIQNRMLNELEKRLELDVDELLSSPKLKLQLSPAELDRQLLDLYQAVTDNPSSDLLRTVLGGSNVGRQGYYLRQQALKAKAQARLENRQVKAALPQFLDDFGEGDATKWIKEALRRNLQSTDGHTFLPEKIQTSSTKNEGVFLPEKTKTPNKKSEGKALSHKKDNPTMMVSIQKSQSHRKSRSISFPNHQQRFAHLSSRIPSLLI